MHGRKHKLYHLHKHDGLTRVHVRMVRASVASQTALRSTNANLATEVVTVAMVMNSPHSILLLVLTSMNAL